MRAYVDSSVLLRVLQGESGVLRQWGRITDPVSSELTRVECLRTLDRARIVLGLGDAEVATRRAAVLEALDTFALMLLDPAVLARASQPSSTALGTLDAIHLASALTLREASEDLVFATHDEQLALGARSEGFTVHGV